MCEKKCKLCRDFLHTPKFITSYHTDQQFPFTKKLTCDDNYVIYLLDDLKCLRSYTGSCVTTMKLRFSNHKSHIRKSVSSCEVSTHFKNDLNNHCFARDTPINIFDGNLKEHLRITIIDKLTDSDNKTVERLKDREAYWQSQLRTFERYGGLNKRDSRVEKKSKSYTSSNSYEHQNLCD